MHPSLLRVLACAVALSLAAVAPVRALAGEEEPSAIDYRGALDQARFQIRKGFFDQAAADLERAVEHPDGRLDAEPWFLLAQVRLQLGDIRGARLAADNALTFSKDPDQESQSAALVGLLDSAYGEVTVSATQPGTPWRPRLEPLQPLVDPGQATQVEAMQKRIRKAHDPLPQTIGLPVGTWMLNGQEVQIRPDEPASVTLSPTEAAGGLAAARLAWLELGVGVLAGLSGESHLLPSPDVNASLTFPIGRALTLGVVGQWTALTLRTEDGDYVFDGRTPQAGVSLGLLLDDGEVVLVRPAVGYRFGGFAGARLSCERGVGAWACGQGRAEDVVLYGNGVAHIPFVELAADYLDRRRTSGVGAGVRVIAEHAFGRLQAGGKSRGGPDVEYTVDDDARSPSRTALRVLVHLSLAF